MLAALFLLKISDHLGGRQLPTTGAEAYSASIVKGYKSYICKRATGVPTDLQEENSEVKIEIPANVLGLVFGHTHTSFIPFLGHVPDSECFISPIPEYQFIPDKDQTLGPETWFKIHIPHRITNPEHLRKNSSPAWRYS